MTALSLANVLLGTECHNIIFIVNYFMSLTILACVKLLQGFKQEKIIELN